MSSELLTRAEAGDRQAFIQLAERYIRGLYDYVRRQLEAYEAMGAIQHGELAVAGLVNETYLDALRRLPERPADLPFYRWLRQIARQTVERAVRSVQQRTGQVSLEMPLRPGPRITQDHPEPIMRLVDILPDPTAPIPPQVLEWREFQQYLYATLARLPEHWREAFMLHTIDGYSIDEISEFEQVPPDTVRRWIELAQELLQAYLEEEYAEISAVSPPATMFQAIQTTVPTADDRQHLAQQLAEITVPTTGD